MAPWSPAPAFGSSQAPVHLSACCTGRPLDARLMDMLASPFQDLQLAAFDFACGLARHAWGQKVQLGREDAKVGVGTATFPFMCDIPSFWLLLPGSAPDAAARLS